MHKVWAAATAAIRTTFSFCLMGLFLHSYFGLHQVPKRERLLT